jgi:pimeloyl-ACP methyl ester carboxylesterase
MANKRIAATQGAAAPPVPVNARIRLGNHRFKLPDGRPVGLSVGGSGLPLVFFHGIGMNRRVYLRLLSRLPQLGFLVVALDAPGHGETFVPRAGARNFAARTAATREILDALGIRRALLVGHSMGGRTVADLAGHSPERALAAVLINPALGEAFDTSRGMFSSPRETASALLSGLYDTALDRIGLRRLGLVNHLRMLGGRSFYNSIHPRLFLSIAAAIVRDDLSAVALDLLHMNALPVALMHGEKDLIIPVESGINAAQLSGATLITLPNAYHSWVLPSPWTFVKILQQLITLGHLGGELQRELAGVGDGGMDTTTLSRYYQDDAPVLGMTPAVQVIGRSQPRDHRHYHVFQIRDAQTPP